MGMDVFGKKPTAEAGSYFRRNVWGWRPLADYCIGLAPDITAACRHWHTNDGDGLSAKASRTLAKRLRASLADGHAKAYIAIRDATLAAMTNEPCSLCAATGVRTDEVAHAAGMPRRVIVADGHPRHGETGWCNGCDGRGHVRPWATHYPLALGDIEAFAAFLEACGGFEIC